MTKLLCILSLAVTLVISACDNEQEADVPDILLELREQPQPPSTTLSLTLEEIGADSLWVRMYLKSEKSLPDTLYHSGTYPFLMSYIGNRELSVPFIGMLISGGLITTILPPQSTTLIEELKIRRRTSDPYAIVGIFNFVNSMADLRNNQEGDKELWLVSNSVSIPPR
ncbi:MAG: hypothetical protein AAFW89_00490 [Bacteroidota bacterium]